MVIRCPIISYNINLTQYFDQIVLSSSTNEQDLGEGNSTSLKLKGKHTESQLPVVEPFGTTEELGVGSWDFDLFQLHKETRHWPLFHLAHHLLFERTNLVTTLGIDPDTINDFCAEIDDTYLPVAYHNNMHGADVLHGCNFMVEQTQLKECITPVEHFSFLVAGMCHDLSHPGKLCIPSVCYFFYQPKDLRFYNRQFFFCDSLSKKQAPIICFNWIRNLGLH